ncbi:PAS domain-containing protein [Rhodospirillum centenum]|uniref:PAS domain-containing protein n=1 Tax=Rhodospirillum centenum TaxID=34018 RepID=UPI0002E85935|nr:PAS domain-containing protein [Rhodospirillum centenum]
MPLVLRHLEGLDLGVVIVDGEGRILRDNAWVRRRFGAGTRSVRGIRLEPLLPELRPGRLAGALADALATGLSVLLSPDPGAAGSAAPAASAADGRPPASLAIVRPLRVEGAGCCLVQLFDGSAAMPRGGGPGRGRQRGARYHAALETAQDSFVTLDAAGRIAWINPAAERRFGRSLAETLGRPLSLLLPDTTGQLPTGGLVRTRALAAGGRPFEAEIATGCWVGGTVRYRTLFIRDAGAGPGGDDGPPSDGAAETPGFEWQVGRIVHEFNNLLMVIQANAGLLSDHVADTDLADAVREIGEAAGRGATLTGRLLSVAGGTGRPPGGGPSLMPPSPPPWPVRPEPLPPLRILRVAADTDLCRTLDDALAGGGHAVTPAADGYQALECLEAMPFDLLLSDARLPGGLSGALLAREVRPLFPDLAIVLVAGGDAAVAAPAVLLPEEAPVLRLPFSPDDLSSAVAGALAAAAVPAGKGFP